MADYRQILLASAAGLIAVSVPGAGVAQAPATSEGA